MKKSILLAACIVVNFEAMAFSNTLKKEVIKDVVNLNSKTAYASYLQCYALDKVKK